MNEAGFDTAIDIANKMVKIGGTILKFVCALTNEEKLAEESVFQNFPLRAVYTHELEPRTDNVVECYSNICTLSDATFLVSDTDTNDNGQNSLMSVAKSLAQISPGRVFPSIPVRVRTSRRPSEEDIVAVATTTIKCGN
jgi:hypothetical protein